MCTTCGCDPSHTHADHGSHESPHTHAHTHDHDLHHYGLGPAGVHVAGISQERLIKIEQDVLKKNDVLAQTNRDFFIQQAVLALNLVSSPGSGKTTLLERTLRELQSKVTFAVIEGDQQTTRDAERIRATGVKAVQINTGKGCHLDAHQVNHAATDLELELGSVLFIENVGNLVCPAMFDLGEKGKVVILSVTEGEDKPLKYPDMFRRAQLVILNKIDLLPYLDFDMDACMTNLRQVNPKVTVLQLSATTGQGLAEWYDWLYDQRAEIVQICIKSLEHQIRMLQEPV